MIKHTHTQESEINFGKLEERIMQINDPLLSKVNNVREMLYEVSIQNKPALIMATGGSKVIAYYLKSVMERMGTGIIVEIIEPRDYFYKANREMFSNLIAISASGNTNGIEEALLDFQKNKYLLCENKESEHYQVVSWGNELYEHEKSFISLATSLGPITLILEAITSLNMDIGKKEIQRINDKVKLLLEKSIKKVDGLPISFKDVSLIQIMSGYDTEVASHTLESNLTEVGLCAPVIHDKGSFCHGRSNLIFQYPDSHFIYLSHQIKTLDDILIKGIKEEYGNISIFDTHDLDDDNIFWKNYYLLLQMYYLSKKIAEDKNIDLTMPEYNPQIIRKIYKYKGEM